MIPESHPLRKFFEELVGRHYAQEIGIRDPQIVAYVSQLLAEFCETDQLFKIHDATDRPLTDLGEMLLEKSRIRCTVRLLILTGSGRHANILGTTRCSSRNTSEHQSLLASRQRLESFVEWMKRWERK